MASCSHGENVAIIYIFFDFNSQETQTPRNVAASYLKQILSHLHVLPPEIQKLYDDCHRNPIPQKPALDILVSAFVSAASQFVSVYLLIDAFDECDSLCQDEMISLVIELSSIQNLHLLVTSRPSVGRLRAIVAPESTINISAESKDIDLYLSAKLRKEQFLTTKVKDEIAKNLATRVKGM